MTKILTPLLFLLLAASAAQAQCIVFNDCQGSLPACDASTNDANLWSESYWFDPENQMTDLAEAAVDAHVSVYDTCNGVLNTLRYLLFLDLDRNGTLETVVKSWAPPAPGTVNYDNALNPNYDGGEVRVFDERPVPADQKYQFALQSSTNDDTTTVALRWNTIAQPDNFVLPELPYGGHSIKWLISNDLGNDANCEYPIVVKDCRKPVVVCLNGIAANIMPTEQITLWASDFLQYVEDNATPAVLLEIGIRVFGTGTGFPEQPNGDPIDNVTFTCDDQGTQLVELWVRDAAGNEDYCETYVLIQDNNNNCFGGGGGGEPTLVCLNGLAANILPTGNLTLWASDFLQYVTDDVTPSSQIELGIRLGGTGVGFPEDGNGNPITWLTFNCTDLGTQFIELWARDGDNNVTYCETYVQVQDNLDFCPGGGGSDNPTVICLNGLAVNIMPTGQIDLWASDFLQYAQDDVTPANELELAIRKTGTGFGFPLDANNLPNTKITFDCNEIGVQVVELWVRDEDYNLNYCLTYVVVQDNFDACSGIQGPEINACVQSACSLSPLLGATLTVSGATYPIDEVGTDGCTVFPVSAGQGVIAISLEKTADPINGVSVLDLIKIKRFILGVDLDLTPYDLIAADANKSGHITGVDIIELRKLILGIFEEFSNNTSWRFVDADFSFPNPQNPFQTLFPETIQILNPNQPAYTARFKAIKVGDLDCDAWPGLQAPPLQDRNFPTQEMTLPALELKAGETAELPLRLTGSGQWSGLQLGLQYDAGALEVLGLQSDFTPLLAEGLESFVHQSQPGALRLVWADALAYPLSEQSDLLTLRVRARQDVRIDRVFTMEPQFEALAATAEGEAKSLDLAFRTEKPVVSATRLGAPQPNPTTAGIRIPLALAQESSVRLALSDVSGRQVWISEVLLPAGEQTLSVEGKVFQQPGVYFWRLEADGQLASGKVVKL